MRDLLIVILVINIFKAIKIFFKAMGILISKNIYSVLVLVSGIYLAKNLNIPINSAIILIITLTTGSLILDLNALKLKNYLYKKYDLHEKERQRARVSNENYKPTVEKINKVRTQDILNDINSMIGLDNVKETIQEIYAVVKINHDRLKKGYPTEVGSLHMVFAGSPGTGKTEVAKKIGKLLSSMGALEGEGFIEASRTNLVGQYVGETAQKVEAIKNELLAQGGGVLFIDEAYSLYSDYERDFGHEAIASLILLMENHKDKICVIFAGYKNEMRQMIEKSNPGLKSRITFTLDFQDYTTGELLSIFYRMFEQKYWEISPQAETKLFHLFEQNQANMYKLGNARYARNVLESSIRKASLRLVNQDKKYYIILPDDISI